MTVFVVIGNDYNALTNASVFAHRKDAEAYVKAREDEKSQFSYGVEECEVKF